MRCPKCGFISFDHLTSCAKCGKDIAEVASELQGTSINVETPMFLSGALAAYGDREESFEEITMGEEAQEGIDISMEDEFVEDEALEMAGAEADIDFSAEEDTADMEIGASEEEAEEVEEPVHLHMEAEAEEEASPQASEKTFEDLDFMGTPEEDEEGGLEFDLEDFLEDIDEDKSQSSSSEDIDLDLDD
ncbi:MAG: hypothetical protein AMJ61_08935 [Desulfobacterales bacterium SG8_35_2]|nr:MAG: hypothetical protein AMJ61_08935 [Desulfobacterales bacterium SG8_35_2]